MDESPVAPLALGGSGRWDEEGQWHPDQGPARRFHRARCVGPVAVGGAGVLAALAWSLSV